MRLLILSVCVCVFKLLKLVSTCENRMFKRTKCFGLAGQLFGNVIIGIFSLTNPCGHIYH